MWRIPQIRSRLPLCRLAEDEEESTLITVGEVRRGVTIELDGHLVGVIEFEHIKMGRGGAVVRLKVRDLRTGAIYERTFSASEKFRRAYLERRSVQFSYRE